MLSTDLKNGVQVGQITPQVVPTSITSNSSRLVFHLVLKSGCLLITKYCQTETSNSSLIIAFQGLAGLSLKAFCLLSVPVFRCFQSDHFRTFSGSSASRIGDKIVSISVRVILLI